MTLLGMAVRTIKGAEFSGTVIAEFVSTEGMPHVCVEATTPGFRRSIHVYPAHQVEEWQRQPEPTVFIEGRQSR